MTGQRASVKRNIYVSFSRSVSNLAAHFELQYNLTNTCNGSTRDVSSTENA